MNNSAPEFPDNFCPICQIPADILRISLSLHVSMCDIRWNELEDCINGVNCVSKNLFHYRDYSHRVLAEHRENLRKRKLCSNADSSENTQAKQQKENKSKKPRRQVRHVPYNVEADDEDNIFMNERRQSVKMNCTQKAFKSSVVDNHSEKCVNVNEMNETVVYPVESTKQEERSDSMFSPSPNEATSFDTIEFSEPAAQENSNPHHLTTNDDIKKEIDSFCNEQDTRTDTDDELFGEDSVSMQKQEDLGNEEDESLEKREECKKQWNEIFRTKKTPQESQPKKKSFFGSSNDKKEKVMPYYKRMPGTPFAVDAFQFGSIPGVTTYFLSHFHSDHYIGLRKAFAHPIYCSEITANLVKKKIRVDGKYLHILKLNEPIVLSNVEITSLDANHCPGSIMLLFRLTNGEQYLHVGDFRACVSMEDEPELKNTHITKLYLDTTYFNPQYVFPSQRDVIDRVRSIVREKSAKYEKALFVCGSYLIGKEKVFLGVLEELGCKLWAQPQKRDTFRCMNDGTILSALVESPAKAKCHVLPMNHLRFDRLKKLLLDMSGAFSHIFAFKPTGWEMGRSTSVDWINMTSQGNITIYGVPYSEHSNYEELVRFVKFIKADKVIPTVPMNNREMYGHLKSIVDSYKNRPKQQNIQQFFSK